MFSSVFFVYINFSYLHPLEYVENIYDHMIYIWSIKHLKPFYTIVNWEITETHYLQAHLELYSQYWLLLFDCSLTLENISIRKHFFLLQDSQIENFSNFFIKERALLSLHLGFISLTFFNLHTRWKKSRAWMFRK